MTDQRSIPHPQNDAEGSGPSHSANHTSDLTRQIVIAMILGLLLGWLFSAIKGVIGPLGEWIDLYIINGALFIGGKLFVNSLKMLVVPLVFVSLVCGVCASRSSAEIGRIGGKTFLLYFVTTGIAISIALFLATLVDPGVGAELGSTATYTPSNPPSLKDVLIGLVPSNPIMAMANANMLQIIVFALLVGLAITQCGTSGERLRNLFEDANDVVMKMVMLMMKLAPVGVFCLVAQVFSKNGVGFLLPLAAYVITVIAALVIHAGLTFSAMLLLLAKLNPLTFYRKIYPAMMFAFSTASSAATMPITLRIVEKVIGVKNAVASFTVPMGATINMDGTAIMQGVATVFIAGAYGVDLTMSQYVTVIATATLASVGTAAVPGAGMITLSMVLLQVGLPSEAIGLILGVDRILDMIRTAINVCGDAVVTTVVAESEGELDKERFLNGTRAS